MVLAGTHYGRVKALFNERGARIDNIGPSMAATLLGLNGAPQAGDTFHVMETEQEAREIASKREQLQREQNLRTHKMLTLDELGRRIKLGSFQELNIIVKGDVDGSVEALSDSFIKLSTEKIVVNVIHKGVGQISENDVTLAAASQAVIVGFQVRPSQMARKQADKEGVEIRLYSIIYDAIEDVKKAMEGMLEPVIKEEMTATVEVRQVYHISKVGYVAGAYVTDGKVSRTDKARLIRDGIVIFTGAINDLKRFKDDVKEVSTNFECGISLTGCNDIKEGDVIETFKEVEVKQSSDPASFPSDFIPRLNMYIDVILTLLFVWAIYSGWRSGAIQQLLSALGFAVGMIIAALMYLWLGDELAMRGSQTNMVLNVVAFAILWIIIPIVLGLVPGRFMRRLVRPDMVVRPMHRVVGAVVSLAKYVVLISCIFNFMSGLNMLSRERVAQSFWYEPVTAVMASVMSHPASAAADSATEEEADTIWIDMTGPRKAPADTLTDKSHVR